MYNSSAYVIEDKRTKQIVCIDPDLMLSSYGPTLEEALDSFEGIVIAYLSEIAEHGGNPNDQFIDTKKDYQTSINYLEQKASEDIPDTKLKLHSKKVIPQSELNQYGLDQELSLHFYVDQNFLN